MSPARRRQMVDRQHPSLSLVRQCALLGVSRSNIYYRPGVASAEDLSLLPLLLPRENVRPSAQGKCPAAFS